MVIQHFQFDSLLCYTIWGLLGGFFSVVVGAWITSVVIVLLMSKRGHQAVHRHHFERHTRNRFHPSIRRHGTESL
jgi:uncharacterized membrane protein YdjX (TVP38/TMEM64 family)